jgi:hypothetical protein
MAPTPAGPGNNSQTVFGGNLDPAGMGAPMAHAPTTGVQPIGDALGAVDQELAALNAAGLNGPEIRALFTLLVRYIVEGFDGVQGYGKTIAGEFMMRTDFGTVFNELPLNTRQHFAQHPNVFSSMVCAAAARLRPGLAETGQLFEGGIYQNALKYGPAAPEAKTAAQKALLSRSLTRRTWLEGLTRGRDLLTRETFPTRSSAKRAEIESLGSYGANMDALPGGTNLPIIELRGLKPLHPGVFPSMALDLFQYVYILNNGVAGPFPGGTLGLGINDRLELAQLNTPHAFVRRVALINQAQLAVNAWGGGSGG